MRLLLFFSCLFAYHLTFGQSNKYALKIDLHHQDNFVKSKLKYVKDSVQASNYLKNERIFYLRKGYLGVSIDSTKLQSKNGYAQIHLGEKFKHLQVSVDPQTFSFLGKHAFLKQKLLLKSEMNPREIAQLIKSIQFAYLNHGYPFVTIQFINIQLDAEKSTATLKVNKGPYMHFSKIHILGDSSISKSFISGLIQIKEGDVYHEDHLIKISNKIKQVAYLNEIKPHEVVFTPDGVELFLYLKGSPSSSANGILGLQPNPITEKINLTGELTLRLQNVLKKGEFLSIDWKSIQAQTQSLNTHLIYPYLFKSPFGIDARFALFKRDTTFLELKSSIGVNYYLSTSNYLKVFFQYYSSNTLGGAKNNTSFSNLANLNATNYGIGYVYQTLDYLPNPSNGFQLETDLSFGLRNSKINDTLPKVKSTTYKININLQKFLPITRRHVIRLALDFESYYAPTIYENESYRFGGLNSLRGFNEQELMATTKMISTIEYRFLLDQNSHVFAFYNLGMYENNAKKYVKDTPYGFGLGVSFGTKIGMFSVSYALGKQFSNPILLRDGKIHFGYIAYF